VSDYAYAAAMEQVHAAHGDSGEADA